MKNPLTPAGIEPATFRFIAQHLYHCATAVPIESSNHCNMQGYHTYGTVQNAIHNLHRVTEKMNVVYTIK